MFVAGSLAWGMDLTDSAPIGGIVGSVVCLVGVAIIMIAAECRLKLAIRPSQAIRGLVSPLSGWLNSVNIPAIRF